MNPYGNYQNAYRKASVNTTDQHKLLIMLYDGAIKNAKIAIEQIQSGHPEGAHNALVKCKGIISELMLSLDEEQGGDIAANLKNLYNYMFGQLIDANVTKQVEPINVVLGLLRSLREAWGHIKGPQNVAPQANNGMMGGANAIKNIQVKG